MFLPHPSPRVLVLCILVVLVSVYFHDSQAFRLRIRGRRILREIRRVIPVRTTRFRERLRRILPRIRLGGARLRRFRLPRLRIRTSRSTRVPHVIPGGQATPLQPITECPNIVNRTSWSAPTLTGRMAVTLPLKPIALYKGWQSCNTHASCLIQAQSAYTEAYSYNFMIGGDGKVYEGRGWNNQSDHHIMPNKKATEYGILFLGSDCPNHDATVWDTLEELIGCGIDRGKLAMDWDAENDMIFTRLEC